MRACKVPFSTKCFLPADKIAKQTHTNAHTHTRTHTHMHQLSSSIWQTIGACVCWSAGVYPETALSSRPSPLFSSPLYSRCFPSFILYVLHLSHICS
jgi:hypothetical protein